MCEVLGLQELADLEIDNECSAERLAVYEPARPQLLSMPVEIFLKICSFLDADFLSHTLAKVCTRFQTILEDSHIWKYWYHSKLDGSVYPPLPNLRYWEEEPIDWQSMCVESASEKRRWENVRQTMRHIVVKDIHFASVDTVCLINNGEFCISGGRDRGMALWCVADISPDGPEVATPSRAPGGGVSHAVFANTQPRHIRHGAHEGWVWDLAADCEHNTKCVYSASWDNSVKVWDLQRDFTAVHSFRCGMSALCVDTCGDIVLAGLYSKRIMAFDVRVGSEAVCKYRPHRGPVLALATNDHQVASISEDRTLAVWDSRSRKTLVQDLRLPTEKAYPVCVSWSRSALYVGDSKGGLHLLHPEQFSVVATHEVWKEPPSTQPACKITGCLQTTAGLTLVSDRGEVKFLYNSFPPREYCSTWTTAPDVTQVRYLNDILVVGSCDSALEFWIPTERYSSSFVSAALTEDSSFVSAAPTEESSSDSAVPTDGSPSSSANLTEGSSLNSAVRTEGSLSSSAILTEGSSLNSAAPTEGSLSSSAILTEGSSLNSAAPTEGSLSSSAILTERSSLNSAVPTEGSPSSSAILTKCSSLNSAAPTEGSPFSSAILTEGSSLNSAVPTEGSPSSSAILTEGSSLISAVPTEGSPFSSAILTGGSSLNSAVPTEGSSSNSTIVSSNL